MIIVCIIIYLIGVIIAFELNVGMAVSYELEYIHIVPPKFINRKEFLQTLDEGTIYLLIINILFSYLTVGISFYILYKDYYKYKVYFAGNIEQTFNKYQKL